MDENKICAFIGHSKIYEDIDEQLSAAIRNAIENHGIRTFWCGGYGAFDQKAASACISLKKDYPDIEVVLIRAYLPKPKEQLLIPYDYTLYPEGLKLVPQRFAISKRNEWIAKNCNMVIAYIDYAYGGAYKTYRKAARRKIHIINIPNIT